MRPTCSAFSCNSARWRPSSSPANAEALERRNQLWLLDARMRQHVPVVERLASDDRGEPGSGRPDPVVANVRIDHSQKSSNFIENLWSEALLRHIGTAAARSPRGETA